LSTAALCTTLNSKKERAPLASPASLPAASILHIEVPVQVTLLYWLLGIALGAPLLWLAGDLLFALLMRRQHARWEAGLVRDADGVRQGCREYTVGEGATALLLIHGFADSPAIFLRLAPALAAASFTCRVMRLPQFAMPLADYRRSTALSWRQAVVAELRELRQRHQRVIIVAHSLGAAVALDAVAEGPETVDGFVLLAPLLGVSNRRSPLLSAYAWYFLLDHTLLFTDRMALMFRPDLRDREAEALQMGDRFVPRPIYREMFGLLRRNRQRAARLRLPLVMVLAPADAVVDNVVAERFFHEYAGESKRLRFVPEASHVVPLDCGWERVVADVRRLVDELPEVAVDRH
jgi:esterase/lipase